ncbi:CYTH domain-containing protein [Alteromonas lipolytica]|uniref:CYTH domain-containing protein n=1 Tax=Alteromonas lipolytica TaxID=1856405 RepID=A0A1E8FF26_9ALTE|nr:CYTH domain-containing protein [Alteromonas lipolytica]OFI34510.1 CYTH domain-containing protein [Alteromonas lipolytica]GGF85124.1 inorganic triphosphatase [Alteromonas lipolytica]
MSETEIKFVLREDPLPALKNTLFTALSSQQVAVHENGHIDLINDYYDTTEHLFQQHKIGMRVRGANGQFEQTVKTSGQIRGGLHQRLEFNVDINGPEPDLTLFNGVEWPQGYSAEKLNNQLEKQFGTHFNRTIFDIHYPDAKIELVFDNGKVEAQQLESPICEIELELKDGELSRMFELANRLTETVPARLSDTSKAAQGYQLLHGVPHKIQALPDFLPLQDNISTEEAFCRALECGLRHWQRHEHLYFETGATKMLTEITRAVRMLLQTVSLYLPVLQCPALLTLHKQLMAYADSWLWQDDLQSLRLLLSKKSLFNKKLSRYPALLSYLQGRQAGLIQAHNPQNKLFQAEPSKLKLALAEILHSKPWREAAKGYDMPLMEHAKGWLSQGWQTIQQTMPMQRRMYASNYTSVEMLLRQTLFNGFLLADRFEGSRGKFRAPWLDILVGIDELNALLLLKKSIFDAELAEQQELLEWVHEKTHSLLHVMERSREVAMTGEVYW